MWYFVCFPFYSRNHCEYNYANIAVLYILQLLQTKHRHQLMDHNHVFLFYQDHNLIRTKYGTGIGYQ